MLVVANVHSSLTHTFKNFAVISVFTQEKQESVVYKIPCECGKMCIAETGRAMHERIKETYGLLVPKPPRFQNKLTMSGRFPIWNEVKFVDRDPHWYTRRVKEAENIQFGERF